MQILILSLSVLLSILRLSTFLSNGYLYHKDPCTLDAYTKESTRLSAYTSYVSLNLSNQKNRKLEVFGRKLEGNHSPFYHYFERY